MRPRWFVGGRTYYDLARHPFKSGHANGDVRISAGNILALAAVTLQLNRGVAGRRVLDIAAVTSSCKFHRFAPHCRNFTKLFDRESWVDDTHDRRASSIRSLAFP